MKTPKTNSIAELLRYVFDHGIGLSHTSNSEKPYWTDIMLEAGLSEAGTEVDRRSIQNWLSGKSVPTIQNLRALADIFGRNSEERREWRYALIEARRETLSKRKRQRDGAALTVRKTAAPAKIHRPYTPFLLIVSGVAITVIIVIATIVTGNTPDNETNHARNITFCSSSNFSKVTFECQASETEFASGTKTIMITFDLVGLDEGERFERVWYLNGQEIHRKESFNDEAWPGYTYYTWPEAFSDGEYALRVIARGTPTTAVFRVGERRGPLVYD